MKLIVPIEIDGKTVSLPTLTYREQMRLVEMHAAEGRKRLIQDLDDLKITDPQARLQAFSEWKSKQGFVVNLLRMVLENPNAVIEVAMNKAGPYSMEQIDYMGISKRKELAHDLLNLELREADGSESGKAQSVPSSPGAL